MPWSRQEILVRKMTLRERQAGRHGVTEHAGCVRLERLWVGSGTMTDKSLAPMIPDVETSSPCAILMKAPVYWTRNHRTAAGKVRQQIGQCRRIKECWETFLRRR